MTKLKAQEPAKGVLQVNSWGQSVMYKIVCSCGGDDCAHTIDIEADDQVTVTIYTLTSTNFWSIRRWSQIWQLLTKGYTKFETSIVMDKQVALNYATVLQSAVKDVEEFRKQYNEKHAAAKLQE